MHLAQHINAVQPTCHVHIGILVHGSFSFYLIFAKDKIFYDHDCSIPITSPSKSAASQILGA